MTHSQSDLAGFGWTPFFQLQVDIEEYDRTLPARVVAVHRGGLDVARPGFSGRIPGFAGGESTEDRPTVGDWLLIDSATHAPVRLLERTSLFKRRAAGTDRRFQLIAANVDTLFVVSSCNQEFNPARIERYLALAREADVTPVLVLTKADQTDDVDSYRNKAVGLLSGLVIESLDARDPTAAETLLPWCGGGQTVAFVGSSGVGKSTLVNTLIGDQVQDTKSVRADDARGRHTTTGRSMHRLKAGGWLLDTPGIRELQLADAASGVDGVFDEIVVLAGSCRFADCQHAGEPDCAVQAAIETGQLEAARLKRYRKLIAEEAYNSASLVQRRARGRAFGKMVKDVTRRKRRLSAGDDDD